MKSSLLFLIAIFAALPLMSQIDPTLLRRTAPDSTASLLNIDAPYHRPFLALSRIPVAFGGYVETNWQHNGTDGVSEGHQFQMRRLTLFVASTISARVKFLSEIEFEGGAREINLEFAAADVELHPLFNLRGGVVMNPIGAFNQNHDGPRWEFTDRPRSATEMLPATWSNVGFGAYGRIFRKSWVFAYEVYVTNGFDDRIIMNVENRTSLPATKANRDRFEESFNGVPLITAKTAIRRGATELGLSYLGGVYNRFREDGVTFDERRRVDVLAVDFNTTLAETGMQVNGEWAQVMVDVPETYSQQFGERQRGGYIDIVQPVLRRAVLGFSRSVLNVAVRAEYVDWNQGVFRETGANIRDDLVSLTAGVSWRPVNQTVFRLNYRYDWHTDLFGNRPSKSAGVQFGFASYF